MVMYPVLTSVVVLSRIHCSVQYGSCLQQQQQRQALLAASSLSIGWLSNSPTLWLYTAHPVRDCFQSFHPFILENWIDNWATVKKINRNDTRFLTYINRTFAISMIQYYDYQCTFR